MADDMDDIEDMLEAPYKSAAVAASKKATTTNNDSQVRRETNIKHFSSFFHCCFDYN